MLAIPALMNIIGHHLCVFISLHKVENFYLILLCFLKAYDSPEHIKFYYAA